MPQSLIPSTMRLAINLSHHISPHTKNTTRFASSLRVHATAAATPRNPTHRASIGKQWREYQGINNWDGLLDPLDDALRSEILRYGQFVESAYAAFDFHPKPHPHFHLPPDSGYRVTRRLHATSSIDLNWVTNRSTFIGYVAVSTDEGEVARLGRRDIVIAYRGTITCLEWLENLRAGLTRLDASGQPDASPMVASGFWSLYTSRARARASLREEVLEEVRRLVSAYGGGGPISLTVTGHSLGAALGVLTAYDVALDFGDDALVTVVSFGGPRVGNERFRRELERRGGRVLRIVNAQDVITKVPGVVMEGKEEGEGWVKRRLIEAGWVYAEVGRELRLRSSDSPRREVRAGNVATCHDLGVYLHLVNSFMSSGCAEERNQMDLLSMFGNMGTWHRERSPVA
ncbi:hypothetical protein QJS04_geneDACA012514 [Acorus gramineus]|uniref:Fungal lipase-type domain-containing protein n=1 Tax=Acorus gramineus TaxID=55184 RepID=A0AAV9BCZ0_ACOGR|nr:hypothetical protein QJS04_geneDACA012514 [Acorus gramineus]